MGAGIFLQKRLFYYLKYSFVSIIKQPFLSHHITHHIASNTTSSHMLPLPSTLYDIADHAMRKIWNCTPYDFQRETIPRLLMMRCTPNIPQALLLIQGTGSGKSAVVQTVGVVDCGVTLVVEELLAVATDQKSKVRSASNAYSPVLAYQLDSLKNPLLVNKLQSKLLAMNKTSNCTLFLYSSPECLMRQP